MDHIKVESFLAIETIYCRYFQDTDMGKILLGKMIQKLEPLDLPIKIRFIYFFSQEFPLQLRDQSLLSLLQNAFEMNLKLRKKLKVGFLCGVVLL